MKRHVCQICEKTFNESVMLPSLESENVWYCEPCVIKRIKELCREVLDQISSNNPFYEAMRKK